MSEKFSSVVMFKRFIPLVVLPLLCGYSVLGQVRAGKPAEQSSAGSVDSIVKEVIDSAQQHLQKGESCFAAGNADCARREFDIATDTIVSSGIDVRADQRLSVFWRGMLERINRYQLQAFEADDDMDWTLQEFNGKPSVSQPKEPVIAEEDERRTGPLSVNEFQRRFGDLLSLFHDKFGRDLVITGADHEEHRRLYGEGSAYDIRARDLTPDEVTFVIAMGRKLGLRVKDFSTPEKVEEHNARVLRLGLPSDTLATAVHIHIDREAWGRFASKPAVISSPLKKRH